MTAFYGTASGFRAYLTARGITLPADSGDDIVVNAKLVVGSEWLDARFRSMFPGRKTGGRSQEREWPRTGASDEEGYAIDSVTVPIEVEYATYEATLRDMNQPGILSTDYTPNKYKRAAVAGAVSVEYAAFNSGTEAQIQLQAVVDILSRLLDLDDGNILSGGSFR